MRILSQLYRRSAPSRKGMTLVEILVVSVIFVIIVTSLLIVFKAGLQSWQRAQTHLEIYQNARAAIDMVTRDLKAAYMDPNNPAITFRAEQGGTTGWVPATDGTEIFFIAALKPVLSNPGATSELCQVGYWRDPATNRLMRYYFEQSSAPPAAPDYNFAAHTGNIALHQKVADNVSDCFFQYHDENNALSWTWNSTSASSPPVQLNKKPTKVEMWLTIREPSSGKTQTFITGVYIPR